jgi:pyridoxine/pyridoxamine 5'-phosphate oxidase
VLLCVLSLEIMFPCPLIDPFFVPVFISYPYSFSVLYINHFDIVDSNKTASATGTTKTTPAYVPSSSAAAASSSKIKTENTNSAPVPPQTTSYDVQTAASLRLISTAANSNKRNAPPLLVNKKRPYRRTKRPKNYNDKSTVTTTSPAVLTPVNAYDSVLGEAEDLLRAATEAQALGRLKMASAYQLLLHARLVGLGKRFDRNTVASNRRPRQDSIASDEDEEDDDDDDEDDREEEDDDGDEEREDHDVSAMESLSHSGGTNLSAHIATTLVASTPIVAAAAAATSTAPTTATATTPATAMLPQALQLLSSSLPSNIEMDTSMMEHLARAAVELHHQRTGRKKSADGLLASPMHGMIGTPEQTQAKQESAASSAASSNKIAWTEKEQQIVANGLAKKASTNAIAKLLKNKTEAQVKAYLKNQKDRMAQKSEMEEEMHEETPRKRGGRGRKPATTAANTVPNANLDARSLLRGKFDK